MRLQKIKSLFLFSYNKFIIRNERGNGCWWIIRIVSSSLTNKLTQKQIYLYIMQHHKLLLLLLHYMFVLSNNFVTLELCYNSIQRSRRNIDRRERESGYSDFSLIFSLLKINQKILLSNILDSFLSVNFT